MKPTTIIPALIAILLLAVLTAPAFTQEPQTACTEIVICESCSPGHYFFYSMGWISEIRLTGVNEFATYVSPSHWSGWAVWKVGNPDLSICVVEGLHFNFLPLVQGAAQ